MKKLIEKHGTKYLVEEQNSQDPEEGGLRVPKREKSPIPASSFGATPQKKRRIKETSRLNVKTEPDENQDFPHTEENSKIKEEIKTEEFDEVSRIEQVFENHSDYNTNENCWGW